MSLLLVLLVGCRWETVLVPDADFDARATVAWSADEVLIAGKRAGFGGPMILRYANGTMETVFEAPSGYIAAADRSASHVWAVLGTPRRDRRIGSEYSLLRSSDRGRTWRTAGPVPFDSVTQLEAVSDVELWIHATDMLGRTIDGGVTWDVVRAPGERNSRRESVIARGGEVLLLSSQSVRTTDGGETWKPLGVDGALVATDAGWYLGRHDERLAVRNPTGTWLPLPWNHFEARPLALRVEGDTVQVLTSDRPERGLLRWYESTDGGRSWDAGTVRADTAFPSWAIAPDGAILACTAGIPTLRIRER